MTTFGIEWDTSAIICVEDPTTLKEKGVIKKDAKWTITTESFFPRGKKYEINENDSIWSLEVQMGVFESSNPIEFNIREFARTCYSFNREWTKMINASKINNFDILTYVNTKENIDNKQNYLDCNLKVPGVYELDKNYKMAYRKILNHIRGVPQITIGINLEYVIGLFKKLKDLLDYCDREKRDKEVYAYKTVKIVGTAYNDTLSFFEEHKIPEIPENKNLFAFMLLCNNMLLGLDKEYTSYLKSNFMFKIRTNLRGIYENLSDNEQNIVNIWVNEKKCNNLLSSLAKDYFDRLIGVGEPTLGFKITNINNNLSEVSPLGIYSMSDDAVLKLFELDEKIQIEPELYTYVTGTAPELYINNENKLDYKEKSDILNFDIGEWYYNGNTVHIEVRGFSTILDLLELQYLEKNKLKNNNKINLLDLCNKTQYIFEHFFKNIFS